MSSTIRRELKFPQPREQVEHPPARRMADRREDLGLIEGADHGAEYT